MRQIGVVVGLTIILTFPVTVVSGAGSQKHSDHTVPNRPTQWKITAQAERAPAVVAGKVPSRAVRSELRR
jgi:hypothetical protein